MQTNLSTGPRTEAGKAVSSMNSLKHGLTSRRVVLPGEDQGDFDRLHEQLRFEHSPEGALEIELVAEIAACFWRLQRARRYESTVLETNSFELFVSHTHAKGFETLLRYMGAIERQLNRAIVRLRETQTQRRKGEARRRPPVKALSATATQFVLSPCPQLTTDDRPLTTGSAELATSHQPLATSPACIPLVDLK